MDFLEKLDYLMKKHNLNKSTLSKACNIPYTTIDGWYKKGYEGLKLTTLRKLANFFDTTLDYWAYDDTKHSNGDEIDETTKIALSKFGELQTEYQEYILKQIEQLLVIQSKKRQS